MKMLDGHWSEKCRFKTEYIYSFSYCKLSLTSVLNLHFSDQCPSSIFIPGIILFVLASYVFMGDHKGLQGPTVKNSELDKTRKIYFLNTGTVASHSLPIIIYIWRQQHSEEQTYMLQINMLAWEQKNYCMTKKKTKCCHKGICSF